MKKIDIPSINPIIASTVKPSGATSVKLQMSDIYGKFDRSFTGTLWQRHDSHKNNIDSIISKLNG